jgi:hypothetical protein
MVLKNKRTQDILDLIQKFGCCDATHIQRLFFRYSNGIVPCRAKLKALTEEGTLKRKRNDLNSKYIYWIGKEPAQIKHKLIVLEYYVLMCQKYGFVQCEREYAINGIRPDALLIFKGKKRFLEVHISNNELNIDKYLPVSRKWVGEFPEIIVIADRKVSVSTEANQRLKIIVTSIEKMGEKV